MKKYRILLFMPLFLIAACSKEQDKSIPEQSSKGQVFKTQTEALEKAKQVEQMLQSGVDRNQKTIEEQIK